MKYSEDDPISELEVKYDYVQERLDRWRYVRKQMGRLRAFLRNIETDVTIADVDAETKRGNAAVKIEILFAFDKIQDGMNIIERGEWDDFTFQRSPDCTTHEYRVRATEWIDSNDR